MAFKKHPVLPTFLVSLLLMHGLLNVSMCLGGTLPGYLVERQDYFTPSETCRQRMVRTVVRLPGCLPKGIVTFACQGTCHSRNVPEWKFQDQSIRMIQHCTCCQPHAIRFKNVTFDCTGVPEVKRIAAMFGCACRPCSDANPVAEKPYDYD